jgi:putative acetyltransferase
VILSNTKDMTINSDCQDLITDPACFNAGLVKQNPNPPEREDLKLNIFQAITPNHIFKVQALLRSFVEWLRIRYRESEWFVDGYFDKQAFEAELGSLPGMYAPPKGRLYLAKYDGISAGCAALRNLGNHTCEMKRLFVSADYHGKRIGRNLAGALIKDAKAIGYSRMLLDTGYKQVEAQRLYRSLGFSEIKPYYTIPQEVKDRLIFMELVL